MVIKIEKIKKLIDYLQYSNLPEKAYAKSLTESLTASS